MIIIGAGMAGCIAAYMNRKADVHEEGKQPTTNHRAVLRFRSPIVSEITGIPFKKVNVRKAIWSEGKHQMPTPALANKYSMKVIKEYQDRSIWNLDTAVRYVAPSEFHNEMLSVLGERIIFESAVKKLTADHITFRTGLKQSRKNNGFKTIINTAPMNVIGQLTGTKIDANFNFQSIHTRRATIRCCNLNQTIYFPDPWLRVYRASLVGDQMIVEGNGLIDKADISEVLDAFGIPLTDSEWEDSSQSQRYGKIAPIDEAVRRRTMLDLTLKLNVYSLGRFATWRNILLDDVVQDVNKIQRMSDHYTVMRGAF